MFPIRNGLKHTIKKKALVVASKEVGLEVNAEKTKCVHGHVSVPTLSTKSQHKGGQ
jgi:hypothetical protein